MMTGMWINQSQDGNYASDIYPSDQPDLILQISGKIKGGI